MAAPRLTAMAALCAAAGVWLSGCATEPAPTANPVPTTTPTPPTASAAAPSSTAATPPPARTVRWIELQPGDCLAGSPPTDPAEVMVNVVDCGVPHSAETFLRADIPVDAALSDTANARCAAGLTQYTGAPGGFVVTYLIDSEQDRTSNNPYPSTVICLLADPQGQPLTGSARQP